MVTPVIENIIIKYLNKEATASELEALDLWLKDEAHLEIFKDYVKTNHLIDANVLKFDTDTSKKQLLTLISKEKKVIKMRSYYRVASYAAVALVMLSIGFLFKDQLFVPNRETSNPQTNMVKSSIEIGTDKATLTLEDGSEVVLNTETSYHTPYAESNGKELVYQNEAKTPTEIAYNFLTIPRGGQFFVQLADGTKVWLNSETQLKYPKNFIDGKPREVELVYGEAYFEVSPSTLHKGAAFKVISENQEIEVLGTQFNLKAYQDESATYTTLVEGVIALHTKSQKQVLKPNEQAVVVLSDDGSISVKIVEVYNEISWKDGVFSFKGKTLKELMTVLSRWYDVEVVFENAQIENEKFTGILGREQSIDDILTIIKSTNNILYEVDDKTIIFK